MERRLYEHNIGHSKFTSLGIPWKLLYTEEFEDLGAAKKRELQVKKMKSRKYIEEILSVICFRFLGQHRCVAIRSSPISGCSNLFCSQ
jgi:putative endonuclease